MSKRNIIGVCVLLLIYIIALVAFHATYKYTKYWEYETTIILRYSLLYLVIGFIVYFFFIRKTIKWKALSNVSINGKALSNVSIKGTTKIVAYASAIKAFLCICPFFFYGYYGSYIHTLIHAAAWIAISAFFFTLHKNMN